MDLELILDARPMTETVFVSDLPSALDAASSQNFDFALLDWNLNGQTARPVAETLKQRGVPVVFISGQALPQGVLEELGVAHVSKPFSDRDILHALKSVQSELG